MKKGLLILFAMLISISTGVQAQSLTVANGATTNTYIPIYGYYVDAAQHNQVLYPASMLTQMENNYITTLSWYLSSPASGDWNTTVTIKMMEVTDTNLTALLNASTATTVWTGILNATESEQTLILNTPYEYQGGNLLVDITSTAASWKSATYTGISYTGGSYLSYNSVSRVENFLPKTTFTYNATGAFCYAVNNLAITNITSDELTVSWNAGGDETAWAVTIDGGETWYDTYDSTYTFYSLDPNTAYTVSVVSLCGSGDSSSVSTVIGHTACSGYTNVPFVEDFEDYTIGDIPSCWLQVLSHERPGFTTFPACYEYGPNARNGDVYFEMESTSGVTEVIALPEMQNISNLKFSFWASAQTSYLPTVFEVGVLEGANTFVPVDTIELITSSSWGSGYHEYTVYFPNYTGTGERIALRARRENNLQYTVMLDDFSVTENNGCFPLSNLHLVAADSANITIAWDDDMNDGASYTIAYWKTGSTDTTYDSASDTTFTATGLDASSSYTFRVTPNCPTGDGEPVTGAFRTSCGLAMVPFFEGFNDSESLECWQRVNCASSTGIFANDIHSGSGCFGFYYSLNPPQTLITPQLGGTDNDSILVSFWYKKYNASYAENFKVGYSTTEDTLGAFIWGNEINPTLEYQEFTASYPVGVKYIAIQYLQNNGWYLFIDDFSVSVDNGCNKPAEAYIDSVGPYTVYLHWTNGGSMASAYNLYYNTQDNIASATAVTGITDTSYILTGLLPQTTYYAWVRTDCGGDNSDYKAFGSFTTQITCAPLTGVTMGDISYTVASINWGYNTSVGFPSNEVEITLVDNTDTNVAPVVISATGTSYVFTGLEAGHSYTATLRNICDAEGQLDTAARNTVNFMTTSCAEVVGDGVPSVYIPTYTYYGNTFSQMIYLASEMPNVTEINGIAFNIISRNSGNNANRSFDVYVSHIDTVGFNGTAFVSVDSNSMYAAHQTFNSGTTGWQVISFDSAFVYNGTSNLLITVNDRTAAYGSSATFASITATGRGMISYRDGATNQYDPANLPSGTVQNNIPAIRFVADCEVPTCFAPMVAVDNADSNSISIHWTVEGIENSWVVGYKAPGDTVFTYAPAAVTDTFYTFTGLNANTPYIITVGSLCIDTLNTTLTVRTACGTMALPYFEDWESIPYNGAWPACWDSTMHHNTDPSVNWEYNHTPNGRYSMFFMAYNDYNLVVSPSVPLAGDQINVTFWARMGTGTSAWMKVGVITDPHDTSTFIPLLTIPDHDNAFHEYEVNTVGLDPTATYHVAWLYYATSTSYRGAIDDITIEQIASCPRPAQPVVTNVTSSQISLSFSGSISGNYKLYITDGAAYVDSASVINDSIHTFTGLSPLTTYTITVHADCGTELSASRTVSATTTMVAESLPYSTGFEAGEDISWMLENGNQTNKWFIDTAAHNVGTHALYISQDSGANNSYNTSATSSVYAYKMFDFNTAGDYAISFDWKADGESSYDYLRVFLVPSTVEPTAGNTNNISTSGAPAGWVALDGGNKLNQNSNWQNHSEIFSIANAGNYNIVFYWRNDFSTGTQPPAAIDNIQINMLSCPAPTAVTVSNITGISAVIDWAPVGTESEWMVTLNGVSTQVSSPTFTATGLSNLTQYTVSVRAICGAGDTSFAAQTNFSTLMCDNAIMAENWDTTMSATTSQFSPLGYDYYKYSYVQTLIDASSLTGIGEINALAFNPTNLAASNYYTHMDVYLANVSDSNLADAFIMPDNTHTFVHVISDANFNFTETGWQTHSFDTAFSWDGQSNILVTISRAHGNYSFSHTNFSAHNHPVARMRYANNDTYPYNINTVDGGTAVNAAGDIRLISCGESNFCPTPTRVTVSDTAETSVSLSWNGTADSYEVACVLGTWVEPTAPVTVSGTTHPFTGLLPDTVYTIGVRAVCSEESVSQWVTRSVRTLEQHCMVPTNVQVSNVTFNSAVIDWTPGEEETEWELNITGTNYDSTFAVTSENKPYTVTGLANNQTYFVKVRAICSQNNYSEWSDEKNFTTTTCQPVSNLGKNNITAHSATISWNAPSANVVNFEIEYGLRGFNQGSGTLVTVNGAVSYNLTGLLAETAYDVYVRSVCAEGANSTWSAISVTTLAEQEGIEDVAGASISLYPNPASSTVTLTGIAGMATVTVVDMNGRESGKWKVENGKLTIDLTGYAQGAYFVHVVGEQVNAIRKLIVR